MEQKKNIKTICFRLDDNTYAFTIIDKEYNELYSKNISIDDKKILKMILKDKKSALIYYDSDEYKEFIKIILKGFINEET